VTSSCSTPALVAPLDENHADHIATTLRAMGDATRVKLMHRMVSAAPDGVCVCDLTAPLGISQPSVSYHLRILRQAGLVARRQEGTFAYYSVVPGALDAMDALLRPLMAEACA
jgi:ArsR family transcriptional regulator